MDYAERSTTITVPIERHPQPIQHRNVLPPPSTSAATLPNPSKTKKLFPNLVKTKHDTSQPHSTSTTSASTKLARQIFSNLNIFSHKPHYQQQIEVASNSSGTPSFTTDFDDVSDLRSNRCMQQNSPTVSRVSSTHSLLQRRSRRSYRSQEELYFETDGGSSCCSSTVSSVGSRRPSIDTISTYLSHDSNEIKFGNHGSGTYGDDDVFLPSTPKVAGSIVGVDPESDMISRFVTVVNPPKWPNCKPCSMCLEELQHDPSNPAVSLIRCEHLMHLNCLNHLIISRNGQDTTRNKHNTSLYIECPLCGIVYGEKHGNQPPGKMIWKSIEKQLPGHDGQNTIQITYE